MAALLPFQTQNPSGKHTDPHIPLNDRLFLSHGLRRASVSLHISSSPFVSSLFVKQRCGKIAFRCIRQHRYHGFPLAQLFRKFQAAATLVPLEIPHIIPSLEARSFAV